MKILAAVIAVLVCFATTAPAQTTTPTTCPVVPIVPAADRVLIISVDGLRPDAMLRADTPNIRALMDEGSFTLWARTTEASVTLPSHVSMVTGVPPAKHKITWNADVPASQLFHPLYPTIFELAKRAGYTTGLAAAKSKLVALNKPGTIDWPDLPEARKGFGDDDVARRASSMIARHRPQVMMIHFSEVDSAGHARGWGTPHQIERIGFVDTQVGVVIAALKGARLYEETLIILTADHGGAGRSHGKDDPRSRHIPWIAVGPGIRKNQDLTIFRDLVINTEDTFATACAFLGIDPGKGTDGKPILQVLADYEMLQPSTKPTTEPAKLPGTTAPVTATTPAED